MIQDYLLLGARQTYVAVISVLTSSILVSTFGIEGYGFYAYYLGLFSWIIFFGSAVGGTLQKNVAKQFYRKEELEKTIQDNLSHYFSVVFFSIPVLLGILFLPASNFYFRNAELFNGSSYIFVIIFLLAASIITLLNIPNRLISISFTNFKIGALASILESTLKLLFALLALFIALTTSNKILLFSVMIVLIAIVIFIFLTNWVNKEYKKLDAKPEINIRKNIFFRKDLLSFSSWNVIYIFSTLFCLQGMTILVGTFGQIDLVASHAIAVQLYGAIIAMVFALVTASIPKLVGELSSITDVKKLNLCKQAYIYCFLFASAIWFIANLNQSWFTLYWFGELVLIDNFFNALCLLGMLTTTNRISIYILQSHDKQKMSSIISFLFIFLGFTVCNLLVYFRLIDIISAQYLIFFFCGIPTAINFIFVLNINKLSFFKKIRYIILFVLAVMICCILIITPKLISLSILHIFLINAVVLFLLVLFVLKLLNIKTKI